MTLFMGGFSEDKRINTAVKRIRRTDEVSKKQLKAKERFEAVAVSGKLETEHELERTYKVKQSDLRNQVDLGSQFKLFDFKLPGGPFSLLPSLNGRHLLSYSSSGHVSVMDRHQMTALSDFTVNEVVTAGALLSEEMVAVAQRKYSYIYSTNGSEVHCLRDSMQTGVRFLEYLPFHYLLAGLNETGKLTYVDVSIGKQIAQISTAQGSPQCMTQSSGTGLLMSGHTNGCVSVWQPTMKTPALKLLSHFGNVTALAVHPLNPHLLVTSGQDMKLKIWDIRNVDKVVSQSSLSGRPASSIHISQSGMLAVGFGCRVGVYDSQIFRSNQPVYMTHMMPGEIVNSVRFCPFEDLLLVGSTRGIQSMLVPGSGSAQIDSFAHNPFETKKQKRETQVRSLLEKLPVSSINFTL